LLKLDYICSSKKR